jgi:GR25 family glycosyltransferase involved in LPS biosynthesis
MRIGITTDLRHSLFSSGHPNACFAIAEVFHQHEVLFLHQQIDREWWDDVTDLKEGAPKRLLISDSFEPLDLVIELSFFLSPIQRKNITRYSVWYNRKPGIFSDIEASVYGCRPEGRDLEGLSAIWLADIVTTEEDLVYFKTLYPTIPIDVLPWIWTPTIVEAHRKQTSSPVWLNSYMSSPDTTKWSIHISESNTSNTSSCTLPLVIIKHAIESRPFPVSNIYVHNTDILGKTVFFKENILENTCLSSTPYSLVNRQRTIDWVYDPRSIVLSHNRFVSLRLGNLEAAWVGIPVIHNNDILRNLGHGLEKTYYKNNSVTGATNAIHKVVFETASIPYINSLDSLTELRNTILTQFYPEIHAEKWNGALNKLNPSINKKVKDTFTILFTDMWENFNESYNTFTLALDSCGIKVQGFSLTTLPKDTIPDLTFFGPFGEDYRGVPDIWPKVHYTGENTLAVEAPGVALNLGFNHVDESDSSYIRLPLWMISIDWFGADHSKIKNPLPLPIDSCTIATPNERSKFCAFIVSNPMNEIRNSAYTTLNSYKPVDSAGQVFNTVGDRLFAGLGGGGGEMKKHEFLKDYRFCISYENNSAPGYTTEKLLHAKAAGCVPIYWGDPGVEKDFDSKGFLNANGCHNADELIATVKELEEDKDKWIACASVPALTSETRDKVRKTLSHVLRRILNVAGRTDLLSRVPEMIGATTTEEACGLRRKREPVIEHPIVPIVNHPPSPWVQGLPEDPLLVTGATQRFWSNVIMWLKSIEKHISALPKLKVRVYVGADVSDSLVNMAVKKYISFAEFIRFPTETPPNFIDFWDPQHYAWKLWICNTVVNDPSVKGRLVFYMDSASILVRWPLQWIKQAMETGVSLINDHTQVNKSWCHSKFCEALSVTEEELNSNQIIACLLLFVGGHPLATELFSSAYRWGVVRDVITGIKWEGTDRISGKPYGHRHDQSILSILSERLNIPRVPLDTVYCDKSARATFHSGKAVYVHRGDFKAHQPYLPGIDELFAINLDRREDRRKSFIEHHSDLKGVLRRLPAYDGRKLTLGPYLARMFKPNDFHWKKAVMGCALSHMKLLNMLVNDSPEIESYCILEDDCRLNKGWQAAWAKVYPHLPVNWDCVYLGGVLPPNREGFASVLERVAPGLSRIAPNQFFGQINPTRYFHFCTYAYVISRAGAKKILQSIFKNDGYLTSADHMMCNPVDIMNNYVLDPLVAGASQDDDPIYQTADFNNFSRVDNFDSDLWNNDERFSPDEVLAEQAKQAPLDIAMTLAEADGIQSKVVTSLSPRFISLDKCGITMDGLYELDWLQELFQNVPIKIEVVSENMLLDNRPLIIFLRKTLWDEQVNWLQQLSDKGKTFKIIHLSDEFCMDPIDFYSWPSITGVLRNYWRPDLPKDPKILIIPLGYHWKPVAETVPFESRKLVWSFAGTDWKNRSSDMEPLTTIQPNTVLWYEGWRDPKNLSELDYMNLMMNSKCIPCPRGQNVETYRFYEALESGCIPLFVDIPETGSWIQQFNMGDKSMDFFRIDSWATAAEIIDHFNKNPGEMIEYREMILKAWRIFKNDLKERVRKLML